MGRGVYLALGGGGGALPDQQTGGGNHVLGGGVHGTALQVVNFRSCIETAGAFSACIYNFGNFFQLLPSNQSCAATT